MDCRTLKSLGGGSLEFLNETHISGLADEEFKDCLEEFKKSDLTKEQYRAIGKKLKKVLSDTMSKSLFIQYIHQTNQSTSFFIFLIMFISLFLPFEIQINFCAWSRFIFLFLVYKRKCFPSKMS